MSVERFPAERLELQRIYSGGSLRGFSEAVLSCPKVERVYGPFLFPPAPEDRSYTFGSFVASIDGRIAFPSSPDGTLIAKSNRLDPDGGLCDYWILNLLRAACDAVIMGSLTIAQEPALTGEIFDPDLLRQRLAEGRPACPLNVVVSRSGANLPVHHKIFTSREIPSMAALSPEGAAALEKAHPGHFSARRTEELASIPRAGEKPLLVGTGSGGELDPPGLLRLLRKMGARRVLIESPTFLAALMDAGALDELFLNTSAIFVGGKALSIGENFTAFTPERHPHARVVSIHAHSESFFYTRYRFEYGNS